MELLLLNYKLSKKQIRENYYNGNIEFKYPCKILIHSLIQTELLCNAITDDNYKSIYFKCSSMCLLNDCYDKLKTINVYKMIYDISIQMKFLLEEYNKAFIGFDPKHILVVNGNKFMYIYGNHLEGIDKQENITIRYPLNCQDFLMAPELYEIKELPCKVNYKCSYFSAGALYLYIYKRIETKNANPIDTNDEEEITNLLKELSLHNTKIFYFLQRCFQKNPVKRNILFI